MLKNWREDLNSGFIIFLIALPLSIGIALAAGAPASAGIMAAIIGGIIGTFVTGYHVGISGPAAGLISVILVSIQNLSDGDALTGFKRMLAATVVVGVLQIIVGLFKKGRLAFLAPSSVVHGMLSAIGVIIMIKQLPILLGTKPAGKGMIGILTGLPTMIENEDLPIAFIGLLSLMTLILWNNFAKKFSKIIPGPFLAVILGFVLGFYFKVDESHEIEFFKGIYHLGPEFLVHVPDKITDMIIFPDFSIITETRSVIAILTIFFVASLESLLSTYAVDKLDPEKRVSDLDFDILGKGIANLTCGLLGAYPIITEIVRSSANIANGAKTKWSNFYHGIFILSFVALFPDILNHIPLAALGAVLFLVGFNLAHPKHFIAVYKHGLDQLMIFVVTLLVTVFDDLLVGVATGVVLQIIFIITKKVSFKDFLKPDVRYEEMNDENVIFVHSSVVFTGYLRVKDLLDKAMTNDKKITIVHKDKKKHFIDHTIKELFHDYAEKKKALIK